MAFPRYLQTSSQRELVETVVIELMLEVESSTSEVNDDASPSHVIHPMPSVQLHPSERKQTGTHRQTLNVERPFHCSHNNGQVHNLQELVREIKQVMCAHFFVFTSRFSCSSRI